MDTSQNYPYGGTGQKYGGPITWFSNIVCSGGACTSGTANFIGGIAVGGSTYFSLENPIDLAHIATTPLPSSWLMFLGGFAGLGFVAYRSSKPKSRAVQAA